jgi:superfamily II DNA or RNA helicase
VNTKQTTLNTMNDYNKFLENKSQLTGEYGFKPLWLHDEMFDFQKHATDWALRKGRAAIFADCGLGKTLMQLVWAENVTRKTNGRVLILTPLAVSHQTVTEAAKFGIDAARSADGKLPASKIVVTNYERLHYFNSGDFVGVCCDESSILKNFDGQTKAAVTEFMRMIPYRLLCTATAAPNDWVELGTSAEALGHMGHMDMLGRFFKKTEKTYSRSQENRSGLYRLRGHAERDFWRWVVSWARAIRKPSDLGFSDDGFKLPLMSIDQHIVTAKTKPEGFLFDIPAMTLNEQRDERRRTIDERCELVAKLCNHDKPVVAWCHLNVEGDLLKKLIPDAEQVSGSDSDESKEEKFRAFESGQIRVMVTKPQVAGFGLNWQHCAHQTFFPSHSFEQWYQAIRRCWRFGQKSRVHVDVVTTEGEQRVLDNMKRKSEQADKMFSELVQNMGNEMKVTKNNKPLKKETIPSWL